MAVVYSRHYVFINTYVLICIIPWLIAYVKLATPKNHPLATPKPPLRKKDIQADQTKIMKKHY